MWSFGCILYEFHTGIPLFQGENEKEQIELMIQTLGYPPQTFLMRMKKKDKYFSNINKEDINKAKSLTNLMQHAPENLINLIKVYNNIYKRIA